MNWKKVRFKLTFTQAPCVRSICVICMRVSLASFVNSTRPAHILQLPRFDGRLVGSVGAAARASGYASRQVA